MDTELEKQIGERLEALPEDIRTAIESSDLDTHIQEIGAANNLHIDQEGLLADETVLVMLGITAPENFVARIMSQVQVSQEVAQKLASTISEKIFQPIQESMKQFHTKGAEKVPVSTDMGPAGIQSALSAPNNTGPQPDNKNIQIQTETALKEITTTPPTAPLDAAKNAPPVAPRPYVADPYREPVE